jgi:DNA-directed RNA polymerase specialized sigma24 family protein
MDLEDELDAAADTEWSLLDAALECLSPLEATIIQLHDESGLSFEEIGEKIGLDPVSARAAWARGLKDLARICKGHSGEVAYREPDTPRSPPCDSSLGGDS